MRSIKRFIFPLLVAAVLMPVAATTAHELDHPEATPAPQPTAPTTANPIAGGPGAEWKFTKSFSTGNLQSDLDFFTQGGEMYASVGTFSSGARGGQSIFQLTKDGGQTIDPVLLSNHNSASCLPSSGVTGLQHDVEATPKGVPGPGDILYNATATGAAAVKADTQLLIDATDAPGRCHDQATVPDTGPRGGLELIDVAQPKGQPGSLTDPREIALTSHIGQSHTVNIDPKRPHIAYSVTSDGVNVNSNGERANEASGFGLDGFEVVDMRTCLEAPYGTIPKNTPTAEKRNLCRPEVYRYRWPTASIAIGHTIKGQVYGCHELEIYADDKLTCGGGAAAMVFDLKGAFDDRGTPQLTDDKPRGTPLPCSVRDNTSDTPLTTTGAKVTDCVNGDLNGDGDGTDTGERDSLLVSRYPQGNASLQGVKYLGSMTHIGRATTGETTIPSTLDIDFDHELEFSDSGRLLIATDERGGGLVPPGATCAQGNPNDQGNGGVHFYRTDRLRNILERGVPTREQTEEQWARNPVGGKAVYRAPVRTTGEATACTAHVMQQIPGQNRIFMGWYSQGTQVVDFTENPDGTVSLREAGFFIPRNANQWVSHVYRQKTNEDGSITYYGVAGDFNLGRNGRNAVEFYEVKLPAPPKPITPEEVQRFEAEQKAKAEAEARAKAAAEAARAAQQNQRQAPATVACEARTAFRSVSARPASRGLRIAFERSVDEPVTVDVFQQSLGRRIVGERLVARFSNRSSSFTWNGRANRRGRRVTDGYFIVRYRTPSGREVRRLAIRRVRGRFGSRPSYFQAARCETIQQAKLERPVFGGRTNRALGISFRLQRTADVQVQVLRGSRVVRTYRLGEVPGSRTRRLRFDAERQPRGDFRVRITARVGAQTFTRTLTARRL